MTDWRELDLDTWEGVLMLRKVVAERDEWVITYENNTLVGTFQGKPAFERKMRDGLPFIDAWRHFCKYYAENERPYRFPDYINNVDDAATLNHDGAWYESKTSSDGWSVIWRSRYLQPIEPERHNSEAIARCLAWLAYGDLINAHPSALPTTS